MATVYGFNHEKDIDRVLRMLDSFERSKGRSVISPSSVRQEARYAKILTLISKPENDPNKDKEATGVEVVWDALSFSFTEVSKDPVEYNNELFEGDAATVFSASNIVSKSKMKKDDIVLLQKYPHLSDTSDWLVVETGSFGSRVWVEITEVTDAANYIGNSLKGPGGDLIEEEVTIQVLNATENAFEEGYSNFADFTEDEESGDRTYYLDGYLLG